jgi:hypothetical protein
MPTDPRIPRRDDHHDYDPQPEFECGVCGTPIWGAWADCPKCDLLEDE